jgi:hypothetical protein
VNDPHGLLLELESALGQTIPEAYRGFLMSYSGEVRDDGLLLYRAHEISERNRTFQVQRFAPGLLAIGDDSGGRLIIIRLADPKAEPLLVDAGALTPNMPASLLRSLADSWSAWNEAGFPIP